LGPISSSGGMNSFSSKYSLVKRVSFSHFMARKSQMMMIAETAIAGTKIK